MKNFLFKYFIPTEENDYRPYILRGKWVGVLAFFVILLFIFSLSQYLIIREVNLASIITSVLVDLANGDRYANEIGSLDINPMLVQAAQAKANDMAANEYFAHTSPEGLTPWHWFKVSGYDFIYAGENLAVNFSDSQDVEQAWMNSQSHRANILNPHFTEIGIATAKGMYKGKETIFVVQMFGRPAPQAILAQAESQEGPAPEQELEIIASEETFAEVKNGVYEEEFLEEQPEKTQLAVRGVSYASVIEELVVSPKRTLLYSYFFLGTIVMLLLNLLIFVKLKVQHPLNIIYAIFLLAFMSGLLYLNQSALLPQVLIK